MYANACLWDGEGRQIERNVSRPLLVHFPSFVLMALNFYLHLCYSKWTITTLLAQYAEFPKSQILSFISYKYESRHSSSLLHVTYYLSINMSIFFSSCTSNTHFFFCIFGAIFPNNSDKAESSLTTFPTQSM